MAPDSANETTSAVERLLVERNGAKKTTNDVFELVLAVHHDAQKRDSTIHDLIRKHLDDDVRMTNDEFAAFMAGRDELLNRIDDDVIETRTRLDNEILDIRKNCEKIHQRAPRRATDPPDSDFRSPAEDNEMGDIRRAWRVIRWAIAAAAIPFLVALGTELSQHIFH